MINPLYTFGCLFHGDYPALARRCLGPFVDGLKLLPAQAWELRLATNAVSQATADLILSRLHLLPPERLRFYNWLGPNLHKYPVLRQIVHGNQEHSTLASKFFMWFDDDSAYVGDPAAFPLWLNAVTTAMEDADVLGVAHLWRPGLSEKQCAWVRRQPWYAGRDVRPNRRVAFVTGGWWVVRSELLLQHDWPPPEARIRGGDVMLGELCRQQGYRIKDFRDDLVVNAGPTGLDRKSVV